MRYDFDQVIERRGTASLKWDFCKRFTGQEDLLPLWVADMDFPAPAEVVETLRRRLEHGIFGYTLEPESYFQAVIDWMRRRHGWQLQRGWLLACPGVVPALRLALLAYSRPDDKVLIQPPVYYPFKDSILNNGRRLAENPLKLADGRYTMDFEQLEKAIDRRTRLLILSSPHNPVARVWRREELERLVAICARRNIVILSDEIHHDLVMKGQRHIPTASLSQEAARITVTLTAATKTFNLAGLGCSLAVIPDRALRERFSSMMESLWSGIANAFSAAATEAAYRHGEQWLEQVLEYVQGNCDFLVRCLEERLPAARVLPLEGTYLAWIDLRGLGLSDGELKERLLRQARLWLDDGPMFGSGGEGFQRLNLACPRPVLREALDRMVRVLGGG